MAHLRPLHRFRIAAALLLSGCLGASMARAADDTRKLAFEGVLCEHKIALKDLAAPTGTPFPTDWSDYSHLVMDLRVATPQRFALWIYTANGLRRIELQPFGENAWFRASIPLQYLRGQVSGHDLAAATNRRTSAFWMSVWGPWGALRDIDALGFAMEYPINHAALEIRNIHLAKTDEGSQFLDPPPPGTTAYTDAFGQWALGDWPRKIHDQSQLTAELAAEARTFGSPSDFNYARYYGYADTHAQATGFFHIEQQNGKSWFVDPDGHLFLATGINGTPGEPRNRNTATTPAPSPPTTTAALSLVNRRLDSWGMTTGGANRPTIAYVRIQQGVTWLGLPDVYSSQLAAAIESAATQQCTPRANDPWLVGYFIGNEPPWGKRESEVCDLILAAPPTATQAKLKEFLAAGDTPERRRAFVIQAFGKYLELVCNAVRKHDPHHLILGIRFGGVPSEPVLRLAHIFDVCSINVYEYEPTKQMERAHRLSGRPIMIGEFHIGVPADGLGAGLVQAKDQAERAVAYQYFVEQAASLDCFVGEWWFEWADEPVLGRMDGENYNIGFIDSTGRAYPELTAAAKITNHRLFDVHSGTTLPFSRKPLASDAGSPSTPWDVAPLVGD